MSESKFRDGWDEARVQWVLAHYEEQTEDEALAEDEAGIQPSETVMNVPHGPGEHYAASGGVLSWTDDAAFTAGASISSVPLRPR